MLRDEKAKAFIEKIHQNSKNKSIKMYQKKVMEKENWVNDMAQRKEILFKAKQRIIEEKLNISSLNKDFIKFQKYRKYHIYNKSLPPIKSRSKDKKEQVQENKQYKNLVNLMKDSSSYQKGEMTNLKIEKKLQNIFQEGREKYKGNLNINYPSHIEMHEKEDFLSKRESLINEIKLKYLNGN